MDDFDKPANRTTLRVAIGNYRETEALRLHLVTSDILQMEFANITPINRAFAPMIREAKFDLSEMAIATFLQAKAYGMPIVLLPVVLAVRFQETALLCRADSPLQSPADLLGARVGVRAYSQTTGMWIRGILKDRYDLNPEQIDWITFEDAHVAQYADPVWVTRAPAGKDMLAMLRSGELDAVIVGNDAPQDIAFRQLFSDISASEKRFWDEHKFVPINHMLTIRGEIAAERPDLVTEVTRMFYESRTSVGHAASVTPLSMSTRAEIDPVLTVALRYAKDLLPRPITLDEVWQGSPL